MPSEPPICRKKFEMPVACESSFRSRPERVMVASGTHSPPSPSPRKINGQKKSWAPLCPVMCESCHIERKKKLLPTSTVSRESTYRAIRPAMKVLTAVAIAPGRMISPDCHAVIRSAPCRKTGRMNTEPKSPTPTTTPSAVPTQVSRWRITRKSIAGRSVLSSRHTSRMLPTTAVMVRVTMRPDSNQSSRWPCSRRYWREIALTARSAMPR